MMILACFLQFLNHVRLFETPWTTAHQAPLPFAISWSLLKLMSIELMMPSNHRILCCPLLFLPSAFPSIRIFSNKWALHIRWPEYWNFNFSIIIPINIQGLFPLGLDWFDLLPVQGTLKSLLQHHNSKASILQCPAFLWSSSHIHTWLLEKP